MNKSGNTLLESYIQNSWENNPQGAGLLWVENHVLYEFKTFKYEELKDKYYELRKNIFVGNIVLHFRISTSGKHNEENLHPFFVNKGLAFVHNGVIQGLGDQVHSDTWYFNENILKGLPKNFLKNEAIDTLIKKAIGHSKLLFLDKNDNYHIINEHLGSFDIHGNWFSNDSHVYNLDFYYHGNEKRSKGKMKTKGSFVWSAFDEDDWWEKNNMSSKTKDIEEMKDDCVFCQAKNSVVYDEKAEDFLCENCGLYLMENCH